MCYLIQNDALKGGKNPPKPQPPSKLHKTVPSKPKPPKDVKRGSSTQPLSLAFSDILPWSQDFRGVTKPAAE